MPPTNPTSAFMAHVYAWMAAGLAVTAAVAFAVASSQRLIGILANQPALLFAIFIPQLILVVVLSSRVEKLSPTVAGALFLIYSALTGVTFSLLLLTYTGASVATTFAAAASMFVAMAIAGTFTRIDLSRAGSFLGMALTGLIVSSIVGFLWHSSVLQFGISVAGVVIFTGLTAWDAQRLSAMARSLPEDQRASYAVVGALALYLDFVNLFLSLLRLFGRRRDS